MRGHVLSNDSRLMYSNDDNNKANIYAGCSLQQSTVINVCPVLFPTDI